MVPSDEERGEPAYDTERKEWQRWYRKGKAAVVGALHRIVNELTAPRQSETTAEHKKALRETLIMALLVTTVVAVGIGDWFFYRQMKATVEANNDNRKAVSGQLNAMHEQWSVMQAQLEEMKNQRIFTVVQLRANIRQMEIGKHPAVEDGKPVGWDMNPVWENAGATDATEFREWYTIATLAIPAGQAVPLPSEIVCPTFQRELSKPTVVAPHSRVILGAQRISLDDARKVSAGAEIILMLGWIEYRDVFPNTPIHHVDWCVDAVPTDLERGVWSFVDVRRDVN